MSNGKEAVLSRRQMVGMLSMPVASVALGSCAAVSSGPLSRTARAASTDAPDNLRGTKTFNIRDFGATGDGKTLDTKAVQATIDACAADSGGTVLVPAGNFLIGTIELKTNVRLLVSAAAKLIGSGDGKDYHAVDAIPLNGDTTLNDGNWALIFAVGAKNVTIEGPGMIEGNGDRFHPAVRGQLPPAGIGGAKRPYLLLFHQCPNLTVKNIDLYKSAYHMVRVIQSAFVTMDGIHIYNRVSGNNDGFHFISAEHVSISNCKVECQDDACALFGSCKFITVTNSSFSTRWSVFRFGGGNPENVTVSNCLLYAVHGCPIKFQGTAGSTFQNMSFSNLILDQCTGPISISIGPRSNRRRRPPSTQQGTEAGTQPFVAATEPATQEGGPRGARGPCTVRNISFSNIHGTVTTNPAPYPDIAFPIGYNDGEKFSAIVLNCTGGESYIMENISLNDIHLTFGGGGTKEMGANRNVDKAAGEYFDLGPIPAYGLYARGVKALTLNNVRFEVATPELRPAVVFEGVHDAVLTSVSVQANPEAESALRFMDSSDILITSPRVLGEAAAYLRVEGAGSDHITLEGGDITRAKTPLDLADGSKQDSVKIRR